MILTQKEKNRIRKLHKEQSIVKEATASDNSGSYEAPLTHEREHDLVGIEVIDTAPTIDVVSIVDDSFFQKTFSFFKQPTTT